MKNLIVAILTLVIAFFTTNNVFAQTASDSVKFSSYRSVTGDKPVRSREGMHYFVFSDSLNKNFIVQIVYPDGKITYGQEFYQPAPVRIYRSACDVERDIFLLDLAHSYREGEGVWEESPLEIDLDEDANYLYRWDYVTCTEAD